MPQTVRRGWVQSARSRPALPGAVGHEAGRGSVVPARARRTFTSWSFRSLALHRTADPVAAPAVEPPPVAARLNDAARVAARVAHDFDNILMGVMGFAELALADLPADSPPARYLADMLKVASDAQNITRQLHQLNRCGKPDRRPSRLEQSCNGRSLAAFAAGADVNADVPEDLPAVAAAADSVRAVVVQLVRNAAEALPGGVVSVMARAIELDDDLKDVLPGPLPAGRYVEITVADHGPGIRDDLLARVGREPFVTTKPRSRGLGLPIAVRTLHAHGGGLRIDTSSKGTAVRAYLPSADLAPPAPGRNVARAAPLEVVSP